MTTSNPTLLTGSTRFQPAHFRGHSRSPSRSPLKKSQFAARELDPLLSNLSPDSTLKALQTTAAIASEESGQDALAKSIAEASQEEREIGIRAAVAAQKLKQWHQEVVQWPWPGRRDRGWGAGFLPPQRDLNPRKSTPNVPHLGFLPKWSVQEYQDRIEDIRDGVEALDLEDVKDHIFSAHVPQRLSSASHNSEQSPASVTPGYGRMKDFTALITATVVQALPDLANLTMLLDTWDTRLFILRQIPEITESFESTKLGLQTANSVVRNVDTGPLVTMEEYETTKTFLGGKVASLGATIDKLLDMLEGQEDTLPKSWIDTLEIIETDYAAWVVEGEHVVIRNDLLRRALKQQHRPESADSKPDVHVTNLEDPSSERFIGGLGEKTHRPGGAQPTTPLAELPAPSMPEVVAVKQLSHQSSDISGKPPLMVHPPKAGHNRGISEVSAADSTFSAVSGLSTAEIVDARSTEVVASPKISVVDNPFRASRDELSLLSGSGLATSPGSRPPMVQRASTASMELILKDQVKQVVLTKHRSTEMLSHVSTPSPEPTTPSQALQQLSGISSESSVSPLPSEPLDRSLQRESPSLRELGPAAAIHQPAGYEATDSQLHPQHLNNRLNTSLQLSTLHPSSVPLIRTPDNPSPPGDSFLTPVRQIMDDSHETLEDRIKDILSTMPNKIRLGKDSDVDDQSQSSSVPSTRSSTPLPSLMLSPVKADRANRQAAPGDVRLFHLTRSGQSRDVPPVKLFVRAVGENGERVMVRVGGGWADLAEYLREYSLHHGHRGLGNGKLEVASYPVGPPSRKDTPSPPSIAPASAQLDGNPSSISASKRKSFPEAPLGPSEPPALIVTKTRKNGRGKAGPGAAEDWTPPPVPPIPSTYTVQTPTTVVTTSDGVTKVDTIEPPHRSTPSGSRTVSTPINTSRFVGGQSVTTTATPPSAPGSAKYTPLGAAGPKSGGRRAVTYNMSSGPNNEAWVEGMVGKARAVSNNTTVVHGPTTTTTTTVISKSAPTNRRVSAFANLSPASNSGTGSPASSISKVSPESARPKSRMSIGDVSGIKRVFLRRKSDK